MDLKAALTLATTALLGSSATAQANVIEEDAWAFDSAFLYYGESDRVSAAEGIFSATKAYDGDRILNLKLTIDTLTGASANGAVAQPNVQTFTRPSGKGQYEVKPGEVPLDDTFQDTRVQINAQWTQPVAEDYTASGGVHISKEYDYLSLGVNGNLAFDFNKKNSTFSVGASLFQDTFEPEGGIPKPFHSMPLASEFAHEGEFENSRLTNNDDKTTMDLMLGFTQVINRRMIMQFNYSYAMVDGFQTDPFKVLSMVNANGLTQDYLYEHRPDERTKQSVFTQGKYHFDRTVLDLSYRFMWDDWEIDSHIVDSRLRIAIGNNNYIEPHFRYYKQSAAEFYQPFLNQSEPLPQFASADYRIGQMTAYTVGLKYGIALSDGKELSFRLEYYKQDAENAGHDAPGELAGMKIYEGVDAVIAQVSYSF